MVSAVSELDGYRVPRLANLQAETRVRLIAAVLPRSPAHPPIAEPLRASLPSALTGHAGRIGASAPTLLIASR